MNFFRYFWLACSGFRTYSAFLNLPLRAALLYWGILAALLGVAATANLIHWFKIGYPAIVEKAAPHLPEFSITNGHAVSALPQPYFSNTNQFPIILDLEKTVATPEKMFPLGVVLRSRDFEFWSEGMKPLIVPWHNFPDGTVNRPYFERLGDQTARVLPYFFFPIWLTIALLGMIQAFLFTFLAGFLERSMNPSFQFAQLFNIALFAITPGSIIVTVYAVMGFQEIRYDLLYFACYCFFLVMASGACRALLSPPPLKDAED